MYNKKGEEVNKYIGKVNKSSIPHLMCEEIEIENKITN